MSSKPAKAAETTETVEAVVQKSLTKNIWTAHANSDVSDSQLNDSDETQIVLE